MFFLLPLGLPCVNWASQECCLFYLRSSLQPVDLPLFYFYMLFPSLFFSHHHSGLLFPILTTKQTLTYQNKDRNKVRKLSRGFQKIFFFLICSFKQDISLHKTLILPVNAQKFFSDSGPSLFNLVFSIFR